MRKEQTYVQAQSGNCPRPPTRRAIFPSPLKGLALFIGLTAWSAVGQERVDWSHYGADAFSSKYAPIGQIDRDNFHHLQVAWQWSAKADSILALHPRPYGGIHAAPVVVDGVLYATTPLNQVFALDATTGEGLWFYDPRSYAAGPSIGYTNRGVAHRAWEGEQRLYFGTRDAFLIALDATTGRPVESFGSSGRIDLTQALSRPVDRSQYTLMAPPIVCRDVVVVGSTIADFVGQGLPLTKPPYGRITAIDLNAGEHRWVRPIGERFEDHQALQDLDLPPLGLPKRVFTACTETLLLAVSESLSYLYAFDLQTGEEVGRVPLPYGPATGPPSVYMSGGRAYIAVPQGNYENTSALRALSLPLE